MNETKGTETIAPTIPPEQDYAAQIAKLETEKENYRKAYLKEAEKGGNPADEDEDGRMRRIAQEELSNSRLVEIAREQDEIIQKALKENKELKLAHLNKTDAPPAALGAHAEGMPVRDTSVTPEQIAHFKSKGWTDADIERYKQNLRKRVV